MSPTLRTASPQGDPELASLIDACFERAGHESRLAQALSEGCPTYDPGLALLAEDEGGPLGWALFLPRRLRLRGCWLPLCVSAPFGVLPARRGEGGGRFLAQAGAQAQRDRGILGAVVLGNPGFFERHGYYPAFDCYGVVVGREELADIAPTEGWRGLRAEDIPGLDAMYRSNHAAGDGTEERTHAAVDWESSAPEAYSLVHESEGVVDAYLRFRVRAELEVRECGATSQAGVGAVLGFLRQLLDEHGRAQLVVHAPPAHPVARALFHRGAMMEANNFRGAALLAVHDWPAVLRACAPAGIKPGKTLAPSNIIKRFNPFRRR